jgi:hypothetical protein
MKGISIIAAMLSVAATFATARAQPPVSAVPIEPRLVDTPWGDFPLERLQPGARLRLTSPDGGRIEARVAVMCDSALDLRSVSGALPPTLSFTDLRAFRAVEVRAMPVWRERYSTIALVGGAVVGALAGAAMHDDGDDSGGSGRGHQASLGEDVAMGASLGGFVGWATVRYILGRVRWRPVTLP